MSIITQGCCRPLPLKEKVINNSSQWVQPQNTQVRRAVDTILFVNGGRTQYGNRSTIQNNAQQNIRLNYLGRTEGQPGGIIGPIKNKF